MCADGFDVKMLKEDTTKHQYSGPVAAKYLETLQRSNEQMVKLATLISKKETTVSNLSSSRALKDISDKYNCEYEASAVGEVNVVKTMKRNNAVIGGEGNGGIIYPNLQPNYRLRINWTNNLVSLW